MKKSIKKFLLESESEKDKDFLYLDGDVIDKIDDISFFKEDDLLKIDFTTNYKKNISLISKISDFKSWLESNKGKANIFKAYIKDFFSASKEQGLNEIIDDSLEIIPDEDTPPNTTNSMIGTNHTMDLEKIFKRSMPKSVRNYSGNLGLGTVVW